MPPGAAITVKPLTARPRKGEPLVRETIAEGFDQAPGSEWANRPSHVVLAKTWLPKGEKLGIEVTPVSSLGVRGKPIRRVGC